MEAPGLRVPQRPGQWCDQTSQKLLHRLLVHCADANVPELTRLARTLDA